jgi:tetratricopeptide (TPR) repeat protein
MTAGSHRRRIPWIAIWALLAAALLSIPATAQPALDPDSIDCLKSREPDRLIAACSAVISRRPLAFAYLHRAIAHFRKGETAQALEDVSEAIRLKPDSAAAYYNRAIIYSSKDPDRAIDDLDQVIRLNPKDAMAHYSRGHLRLGKNQLDLAIPDLDQAIRLDPNYYKAHFDRGVVHLAKLSLLEATREFDETIRLKPDFGDAYFNRGVTWFKRSERLPAGATAESPWTVWAPAMRPDDAKKAIDDFDQAIRLAPDIDQAYWTRGLAQIGLQHYDKAIGDLTEAIRRGPDNKTAYLARGTAWLASNRPDRARDDYAEIVRRAPASSDGYVGRALANARQAEWALVVADLTEAERLNPDRHRGIALAFARRCVEQRGKGACAAETLCTAHPWFCSRGPVRDMDTDSSK